MSPPAPLERPPTFEPPRPHTELKNSPVNKIMHNYVEAPIKPQTVVNSEEKNKPPAPVRQRRPSIKLKRGDSNISISSNKSKLKISSHAPPSGRP